jgi:hypothetical protein
MAPARAIEASRCSPIAGQRRSTAFSAGVSCTQIVLHFTGSTDEMAKSAAIVVGKHQF